MTGKMFDLPEEQPNQGPNQGPRRSDQQAKTNFVDQMMYLLTAPHVGWPGWEDQVTARKDDILLQRLAFHREIFDQEMCTEMEAMLYISSVSLAQPLNRDWTEIYMWLFQRWSPEGARVNEIEAVELNRSQVEDLTRLRRWIYRTQMNHLKGERKEADQKEVEEEKRRLEALQPRMFDDQEQA